MVAVVIVVMRVLFRVLLGGGADGGLVLVDLPEVPLPDWVLGLHLLGPVTRESRARRPVRRAAARDHRGLRRCGQRAGQPQAAAPLGAGGAARGRHGTRRGGDRPAPAGRERAPGQVRAGASRRGHPAYPAAPPLPGPGPRGLARAVAAAGRRHGHPRLRSLGRRPARGAPAHRCADAARPVRCLRRRVRRPRPHRATRAGDSHAAARRGRRRERPGPGRPPDRPDPLPPRSVALAGVRRDALRHRHRRWSPGGWRATSSSSPTRASRRSRR